MHISIRRLKGSYFLLLCWIVGVWMLHASVQVAEGLAKLPLFPCSCGLTGRRKKKRTDYNSTITSRQKPIPPSPWSERKKRGQRSPPPPQPPLTDNEENTAGRREEREGEKVKRHERREDVLPSDGEVSRWAEYGEERNEERGEEGRGGGLVVEGVGGSRVEGRVYLIGDPGGTPLPEA